MGLPNQGPIIFGKYNSVPKPYSFNGMSGFWTVPSGGTWFQVVDSTSQIWVSPNPITRNPDGTVTGSPLYAATLNLDGTLVFQDAEANRSIGIDSPPPSFLSQNVQ
jgi:hypothetical protein